MLGFKWLLLVVSSGDKTGVVASINQKLTGRMDGSKSKGTYVHVGEVLMNTFSPLDIGLIYFNSLVSVLNFGQSGKTITALVSNGDLE
jgi:hypothetical protein